MRLHGVAHVFLLCAALAAPLAAAAAESIAVGTGTIQFDPGEGMCALDRSASAYDRLRLDREEQTNSGGNAVLAIYVDCAELALARAGLGTDDLGVYAILLTPLRDGEIEQVTALSRGEFLAEAVRLLDAGGDRVEFDLDRINRAQDAFVGPEADDIAIPSVQHLGLLAVDETAAYAGLLFTIEQADYSTTAVGVLGLTLVDGYVLNYSLYDDYVDETTQATLLADVQAVMQRTVALNPSGAFPVPRVEHHDDWRPIVNVAVAVAIGSVLMGLVRAWRRRREE